MREWKVAHILGRTMRFLPDEAYIRLKWLYRMGGILNLKSPKTYNEKLQWLKLYDRNPLYTTLVDKYLVKQYVSDKIGAEHVIPVIDNWDSVEDIKWDALPEQFVIKCSHDCGGMVICRDKSKLDIDKAKAKLEKSFNHNYYWDSREWPYKNVKKKIFCEAYMEDEFGELRDYKFFCFDGDVKAMFIASDRQKAGEEVKFDFFDSNFNHLPFKNGHENAPITPSRPRCFEEMKELASVLSCGIPQVRVDFYEVDGRVYFGEMTFFHFGGMVPFEPKHWDYKFGEWIKLPVKQ